jgi:hypothetical protein
MLEDSLRALQGDQADPPPALALPLLMAADWRLTDHDARAADSLARVARKAAAVDSLALERSGYVGRAELIRARALAAIGDGDGARRAVAQALIALTNGFGGDNVHTRDARALADSLHAIRGS